MSSGKIIEQLTAIIENTLQSNERVKVSHNVSLKDELGIDRQIDVLIEYFENKRFTFRVIIECKEKNRDGVEVNQMQAFVGTFKSLKHLVHKAIFVSTSGFQKGAQIVGENEGILLYTLSDLSKAEVESWYQPKMQNAQKQHEILEWRLLLREEDGNFLDGSDLQISPTDELHKKDGNKIVIHDLIARVTPFRANQLHNHLLNALLDGHEIDKEKYINISLFQLAEGFYLQKGEKEIPIGYLELRILFWIELREAEQSKYKLYKDSSGKVVADVVLGKVDYSSEGVYLSVVGDQTTGKKEYYLIDGNKNMTKLEFREEIVIPEKNQIILIAKNPYSIEK